MLDAVTDRSNLIRQDLFSRTYRAAFTLNGETAAWDVIHIQIPFPEGNEDVLKKALGMDLSGFYQSFAEKLCSSIRMMDSLHITEPNSSVASASNDNFIKAQVKNIKQNLLDYIYIEKQEKEGRSNLYIICRPFEAVFASEGTMTYKAYLQFASRMVQLAKTLHEQETYFTFIDPLSIIDRDGRILLSNLLFCGCEGEVVGFPEPYRFSQLPPASEAQSLSCLAHFLDNLAAGKGPWGTGNGKRILLPDTLYKLLSEAEDINTNETLRRSSSILKELNSAIHREEKVEGEEKGFLTW